VSLDMVEFPMLSSASIDNMTPQHEMNPRLVPGLGKAIMLGKDPERQREIEFVQTIIRNCARAGIPAIKYNMNLLGVLRTADTPGRGGTRLSTWRLAEAKEEPALTAAGVVTAETAWERITYSWSAPSQWPPSTRSDSPVIPTIPASRRAASVVSCASSARWRG
jgi:mannonate dehydratase